MTIQPQPPASAATTLLVRLRQRQLGRALRLFYERTLREPLPADMVEALRQADAHGRTVEPDAAVPPPLE